MTARNKIISGRIYLHGSISYYERAVCAALGLQADEPGLSFRLCLDVLRSIQHHQPVYRVDYTIKMVEDTPAGAPDRWNWRGTLARLWGGPARPPGPAKSASVAVRPAPASD